MLPEQYTTRECATTCRKKTADEFGKKHVKGGCQHQPIVMGRCAFVFDFPFILVSFSCIFFPRCYVKEKKGILTARDCNVSCFGLLWSISASVWAWDCLPPNSLDFQPSLPCLCCLLVSIFLSLTILLRRVRAATAIILSLSLMSIRFTGNLITIYRVPSSPFSHSSFWDFCLSKSLSHHRLNPLIITHSFMINYLASFERIKSASFSHDEI